MALYEGALFRLTGGAGEGEAGSVCWAQVTPRQEDDPVDPKTQPSTVLVFRHRYFKYVDPYLH